MPNLLISLQPRPRNRRRTVVLLVVTALVMIGAVWFVRAAPVEPATRQAIFFATISAALAVRLNLRDKSVRLTRSDAANVWELRADGVNGLVRSQVLEGGRLLVEVGDRVVTFEPPRHDASVVELLSRVLADPGSAASSVREPQLDSALVDSRVHENDRALILAVTDRQSLAPVFRATSGFTLVGIVVVAWLT